MKNPGPKKAIIAMAEIRYGNAMRSSLNLEKIESETPSVKTCHQSQADAEDDESVTKKPTRMLTRAP